MINIYYPGTIDRLNVAELCSSTYALGPGRRFAIWLQGCHRNCIGCISPEWREFKKEIYITPKNLSSQIGKNDALEGITISGGEPMLQAGLLAKMLDIVHSHNPYFSVICYTGYTLETLSKSNLIGIKAFLKHVDVLIDGPYIKALDDGIGLRGSSNQRIHFFTNRYANQLEWFKTCNRSSEIHLREDYSLYVGLKK